MKRRRKRSKVGKWRNLTAVLWVAFALNTYIGICRSPLTVARRLTIVGAQPDDHLELASAGQVLKGIPCLQVNPEELRTLAMKNTAINSVDLGRNIFGAARLTVHYRTLVAKLSTNPQIAMSEAGVLFKTHEPTVELPTLILPRGFVEISFGMVGTWESATVGSLCVKAKKLWPTKALEVEFLSDGHLCLNIDSGRVVLGSTYDLDQKLKIVVDRIQRYPTELAEIQELVLTNPSRPTIVRKPGDRHL